MYNEKEKYVLFCTKTIATVECTKFLKNKFYFGESVHDLLLFKGENGIIIQAENYFKNEWIDEHFHLEKLSNLSKVRYLNSSKKLASKKIG